MWRWLYGKWITPALSIHTLQDLVHLMIQQHGNIIQRTSRPMLWRYPSSLYLPLISWGDKLHSPRALEDKLKVLLTKPTGAFGDSDVDGTRRFPTGILWKSLKHMNGDCALTMHRLRELGDTSWFRPARQWRVDGHKLIPLDMTGISSVGVGVDSIHKISFNRMCSWLRGNDLWHI